MVTIACVLKTGGWRNKNNVVEYTPEHVQWLSRMVADHVTIPHRFVCLSDVSVDGVETIPLQDDLPGWWSKMEMFRDLDQAFYLDLDTVIVRNIDHIVSHPHKFTVLRNLSSTDRDRIGSGLMAWNGDYSSLYYKFIKQRERHMAECVVPQMWGDQGFIQAHHKNFDRIQDLFPGQVMGFKTQLNRGDPTHDCRIVVFNGEPKPWEVDRGWIPKC